MWEYRPELDYDFKHRALYAAPCFTHIVCVTGF